MSNPCEDMIGELSGSVVTTIGHAEQVREAYDSHVKPELEGIMDAWGIIANAYGGNWDEASDEWRGAAERWRDTYL